MTKVLALGTPTAAHASYLDGVFVDRAAAVPSACVERAAARVGRQSEPAARPAHAPRLPPADRRERQHGAVHLRSLIHAVAAACDPQLALGVVRCGAKAEAVRKLWQRIRAAVQACSTAVRHAEGVSTCASCVLEGVPATDKEDARASAH
eukprot:5343085-Pleurochrysis_carterae.AAC.2